jgi:uncharacterized membrane protein
LSNYRYDKSHRLRVIAEPVTLEHLLDCAFSPIRQYAQFDEQLIRVNRSG